MDRDVYLTGLDVADPDDPRGPGSARLDFARPDGSYAGWTVVAGRNGSGKTALLAELEQAAPGPTLLLHGDAVAASGGERVAAVLDAVLSGLTAAGADCGSPATVLIDDVESHLDLQAQRRVGAELTAAFPNVQFIVTTHSPYVCQAADPGGLIRLPGAEDRAVAEFVSEDLYHRVVFGSADDAALSELFGLDSAYSDRAEAARAELVDLERKIVLGQSTHAEAERHRELSHLLTSSPATRADELAARLPRPGRTRRRS